MMSAGYSPDAAASAASMGYMTTGSQHFNPLTAPLDPSSISMVAAHAAMNQYSAQQHLSHYAAAQQSQQQQHNAMLALGAPAGQAAGAQHMLPPPPGALHDYYP